MLPPLLYAAGQELSLRDLRAVWRPVAVLATGLVLASAAAVAAVAYAVTPLPASMAFVLGAVLASTDPVAVTALGRRLRAARAGAGAGAGGEPVQRRDQPGAVPGRGLLRRRRGGGRLGRGDRPVRGARRAAAWRPGR